MATATLIPDELKHLCVPIARLKPYPRNNKDHDTDISIIAASIKANGFRDPVEVDKDNEIIAGHGRVLAAQSLGMTEVPVIKHSDMTKEQAAEYRIANNKSADQSTYNYPNLCEEILGVDERNGNLNALGMDMREIEQLMTWTPDGKGDAPGEVEFTEELLLEHNYIVLYFDNPLDWEVAKELFKLKKVKDLIPRKGQPTGIGRVLSGAKVLEEYFGNSNPNIQQG